MKELAIYLREKIAGVGEEITATLEPFMSDREPHEPLVLNLNQGEGNGES